MDCHRPRRTQRYLLESPVHNSLYLTCFLIQPVADVLPFFRSDLNVSAVLIFRDQPRLHLLHSRDLPVVVAGLAGRVVADEHHLRALFQPQTGLGGIGVFREYSFDRSLEGGFLAVKSVHLRLVDGVGLRVVGRQADPALVLWRNETWIQPLVQLVEGGVVRRSRAHLVQNVKEQPVALAVDFLQFDRHEWQALQNLGIEEEG